MYKGETYLLENERAKCKLVILEEGVFHLAITEKDFFVNPCFEPFEMRKINRFLDFEMKCKIGENLYLKLDEDFRKVQIFREYTTREIVFEVFDIDLCLKEINGEVCQGNSFSISKSEGEKFYGLATQKEYGISRGEGMGMPYLYSSRGYGLINNTLALNSVDFSGERSYTWSTDWTEDFSIYLFMGTPKKVYKDLIKVIGKTPMPLKASLGFMLYKQHHEDQGELLKIAQKYKEKHYPVDMISLSSRKVDEYYEENKGLKETEDFLKLRAWLNENKIGTMTSISKTVESQLDFIDAFEFDENEIDSYSMVNQLGAGKGIEKLKLHSYTYIKNIYEMFRSKTSKRCMISSGMAYLGSQRYGTQIRYLEKYPTWGALGRQISFAIDFCASGMGYFASGVGEWDFLSELDEKTTELYIRWVQFLVFCPIMCVRGMKSENEMWSYGILPEFILKNQLKLRYELMPYIYSKAYELYKNGTPILRGLFFEFPEDEKGYGIKNEYMFGDTLLVVPITESGQTVKKIYFPKGAVWYDFYSREVYIGGHYAEVEVSLEHIPIFVRGNRILPLGSLVSNTKEKPDILEINVFGDKASPCFIYEDDGTSYDYESGDYQCYRVEYKNHRVYIYDHETNQQLRDELPWRIKMQIR